MQGISGDADKENRLRDRVGEEEGEGEMNGESTTEAYTPPHVKQPMEICRKTHGSQAGAL